MMKRITSSQNSRIRRAAQLRDGRQRRKQGRFLIDGHREIESAIAGGIKLDEVFLCPELGGDDTQRQILEQLARRAQYRYDVTVAVMEKLAYGDRSQGALAIGIAPQRALVDLKLPTDAVVAVLCGVEKPGNLGAIIRSADGAGIHALVVADGGTDLYNPNTIRASLGTVFSLPVVAAAEEQVILWLQQHDLRILAARVDGAVPYTRADFTGPVAIVLGSEAQGLSSHWAAKNVTAISLPMRGRADSLNVSATAAVLFYEARRQRQ